MPKGFKGTGISYQTYNCLHCDKVNKCGRTKFNKFCDNVCQGLFKWKHETIPKIEAGLGGIPSIKKYLLETRGEVCECCRQGNTWNNKPLVLQLDHIDGDSDNNYLTNLRLLCPNCHTQTETFGNAGQGNRYKKNTKRNSYLREYKSLGA